MSDNDNIYSSSEDESDNQAGDLLTKKLSQINEYNEQYSDSTNVKEDLEEIEFGKLVEVKKKLLYDEKLKIHRNVKVNKNKIETDLTSANSGKLKYEPKEFSALLKPKKKVKNIQKTFRRDPRFDDLSGELKPESHEKRFAFVKDVSKDYLNKLQKLKKDKKINTKEDYDLYKKQMNFVKGWVKKKEYSQNKDNIQNELKQENKKRAEQGQNPIYLKQKQIKHIVTETYKEKRNKEDNEKFLKRKKHRDMINTRKIEKSANELNFKK